MIIVVEGPDGSGKSTFIRQLRELKETPYFLTLQWGGPPSSKMELEKAMSWVNYLTHGLNLVLDRHPAISEVIYGSIIRGRSYLETDLSSILSYLSYAGLLVYCRPPSDVIKQNVDNSDQMIGVKAKLSPLIDQYDTLMADVKTHWTSGRVVYYDYTSRYYLPTVQQIAQLAWPRP